MTTNPQAACPNCQHDQHLPGTECGATVGHGPNRWHLCLCLARPGAALPCPPQMTCQGGTLGYSDVWHLQQGHMLLGEDGEISSEALKLGVAAVGFPTPDAPASSAVSVVPPATNQTAEAAPVKQRADLTETEWAEQERARFERLYTRETVRADLAEQRAETAARDADIYQQRLERLSEGYTEQRKRAEAMERAMESTAADALKHRGCHRDLMAQCLRAERAEAEAGRLRTDRSAILTAAASRYEEILANADTGQDPRYWTAVRDITLGLRAMAAEAPHAETRGAEAECICTEDAWPPHCPCQNDTTPAVVAQPGKET